MFALSVWLMLDNHAGRSRRHSAVILQWDWGGKQSRPGRAHAVSVMSGNHERMAGAFIREEHVRNESTSEAKLARSRGTITIHNDVQRPRVSQWHECKPLMTRSQKYSSAFCGKHAQVCCHKLA